MFKNIALIIFLICAPNICGAYENANNSNVDMKLSQKAFEDQMLTLKIMMSKLRELLYSLKDIKELESAGLPHRDAVLMYNTLLAKITQAKSQTLTLITSL